MRRAIRHPVWIALSIVGLLLVTAAPVAAGVGPPNDAFANATVVTVAQLPYTNNLNAAGSSAEATEPAGACDADFQTVWYRITPGSTTYLRADTIGSAQDSIITIFQGNALASLAEVGCNDDATTDSVDARITFKATGGLTYYVRVSLAQTGLVVHLRKVTPPAQDAFASAKAVTSLPFVHSTSTSKATMQAGEPDPEALDCAGRGPTIWYRYKPGTTKTVRVDVTTAVFDPWIAVFRGTTLGGLTLVDCNDDTVDTLPNVAFRAVAGTTYYVQIGGYANENGALTVRLRKVKSPLLNDNFAGAQAVIADGATHEIPDTGKATTQTGESQATCADRSSASVWYSFTPTGATTYSFDASSTNYLTVLSVYTGTTIDSLTPVACNFSDVEFSAVGGTKYYIRVAGYYGQSGNLVFNLASVF